MPPPVCHYSAELYRNGEQPENNSPKGVMNWIPNRGALVFGPGKGKSCTIVIQLFGLRLVVAGHGLVKRCTWTVLLRCLRWSPVQILSARHMSDGQCKLILQSIRLSGHYAEVPSEGFSNNFTYIVICLNDVLKESIGCDIDFKRDYQKDFF